MKFFLLSILLCFNIVGQAQTADKIIKEGKKIKFFKNLYYEGIITKENKLTVPYSFGTLYIIDKQNNDTIRICGDWIKQWESDDKYNVNSCLVRFPNENTLKSTKAIVKIEVQDDMSYVSVDLLNCEINFNKLSLENHGVSVGNVRLDNENLKLFYSIYKKNCVNNKPLVESKSTISDVEFTTSSYIFKGTYEGWLNIDWTASPCLTEGTLVKGTMSYPNGIVFEGTFKDDNSYKNGKLSDPSKGWISGKWDVNNTYSEAEMDWKFDYGHFVGSNNQKETKGNLFVSDNEIYKDAVWNLPISKDLNYKNIEDGYVYYSDSLKSTLFNYYVRNKKIQKGDFKGVLESDAYNGHLDGKFEKYLFSGFADADVNTSIYKGHLKGEMKNDTLIAGEIDAKYSNFGYYKGIFQDDVFTGRIESNVFTGQVNMGVKTGKFQVDKNGSELGLREGTNIEYLSNSDSLVGQWKNFNCVKGHTVFSLSDPSVIYEGNVTCLNNVYKVDIKKDKKLFKSFKLNVDEYKEKSLLLGIYNAVENYESELAEARRIREEKTYMSSNSGSSVLQAIDLGLSVKWAACNLGATKPEGYGNYYAWGETKPKATYTGANCNWYAVDYDALKSKGVINSRGNLTARYDAATANWGTGWRMPTLDEIKELKNRCRWNWTTMNGVKGYKVTGPSGKSIFLPAAGYRNGSESIDVGSFGNYWSSNEHSDFAYGLYFYSDGYGWHYDDRGNGRSVRPVCSTQCQCQVDETKNVSYNNEYVDDANIPEEVVTGEFVWQKNSVDMLVVRPGKDDAVIPTNIIVSQTMKNGKRRINVRIISTQSIFYADEFTEDRDVFIFNTSNFLMIIKVINKNGIHSQDDFVPLFYFFWSPEENRWIGLFDHDVLNRYNVQEFDSFTKMLEDASKLYY